MSTPEVVWLTDERTFAWLINVGAYYSLVKYTQEGIDYEVLVDNDEYEYIEREGTDRDSTKD